MKNKTFRIAAAVLAVAAITAGSVLLFGGDSEPDSPAPSVTATVVTTAPAETSTTVPATTVPPTTAPPTTVPETTAPTETTIPDEVPAEVAAAIEERALELSESLFVVLYSGDRELIDNSVLDGAPLQVANAFYEFWHFMPPSPEFGEVVPELEGHVFKPFGDPVPYGEDLYLVKGFVGLSHHELNGAVTNALVEYRDGDLALVDFTIDPFPAGDGEVYWVSELAIYPEQVKTLMGMVLDSAVPTGEPRGGWFFPPADRTGDPRWMPRETDRWTANLWVEWTEDGELFHSDETLMRWTGWDMATGFVYGADLHTKGTKYYQGIDIPGESIPNDGTTVTLGYDADGNMTAWWVVVEGRPTPTNVCDDNPDLCLGRDELSDLGLDDRFLVDG